MKINRERILRILSMLYIVALIMLLVMPLGDIHIEKVDVAGVRGDYAVHCLAYMPWMFLGWSIFEDRFKLVRWFVAGVAFVIVLEVAQYLIPYRGYNIYDLIAGEVGVVLSLLGFRIVRARF